MVYVLTSWLSTCRGKYLQFIETYGVFFSIKKCAFDLKKNPILCLFLKNVSPSKRVICFIPNNSHLSMVKDIAFYALYKSRVLIIPCKADDSSLFIGVPDEIYPIVKLIFSLFCGVT